VSVCFQLQRTCSYALRTKARTRRARATMESMDLPTSSVAHLYRPASIASETNTTTAAISPSAKPKAVPTT
jgi:hypothetical protein